MKIIYINPGDSSVMEAQVLTLLDYYSKKNAYQIVLLQGFRDQEDQRIIQKKITNYPGISVKWFRTYANYNIFDIPSKWALGKVLLKECSFDTPFIVHIRGEIYGSYVKSILLRNKFPLSILTDIRGVALDEIKLYNKQFYLLKKCRLDYLYKHYRKISENPMTDITVVSEEAKRYFQYQHNFDGNRIVVHPNIAGQQFMFSMSARDRIRKELNIPENQLVAICSSNGTALWQKDKSIIEILNKKGLFIINLTREKSLLKNVVSRNVPFKQMPDYLSAADISLLWRDDNPVNNTASPSKMSEFACMGLFVIHNGTVGIATEYIKKSKAGIIISDPSSINNDAFETINAKNRDVWCKRGIQVFGIEKIAGSYLDTYSQIIKKYWQD